MEKEARSYLISVIVPVYNVKAYLPRCIESIQGQTFPHLQIILIDDGSTDGSGRICDAYAKDDVRIEVLHTPNGGLVMARKAGLRLAAGDYIGFVDGDDFIDADMYGEMLAKILETKADFVHTGYYSEHKNKQAAEMNYEDKVYDLDQNRIQFMTAHTVIFPGHCDSYLTNSIWSKLFKAELIRKSYSKVPDDQQFGEDVVCLCLCIMEARRIAMYRNAYYHYVIRAASMSHVDAADNIVQYVSLYKTLSGIFRDYGCFHEVKQELEKLIKTLSIAYVERCCLRGAPIETYNFPMMHKLMGKKIVIYGAGRVGQNYYTQISRYRACDIVAWADRDYACCHYEYCAVENPAVLKNILYDIVIIAVKDVRIKDAIQIQLESMGVEKDKILWGEPKCII